MFCIHTGCVMNQLPTFTHPTTIFIITILLPLTTHTTQWIIIHSVGRKIIQLTSYGKKNPGLIVPSLLTCLTFQPTNLWPMEDGFQRSRPRTVVFLRPKYSISPFQKRGDGRKRKEGGGKSREGMRGRGEEEREWEREMETIRR